MEVNGIAVMRRRKDSWLNATQILKVAGIEKGKRTKVLEKEILIGEHEKVQGGYGKYQGTWIKYDRGLEFCRQYGVEEALRPLLQYDMGHGGGIAGQGGLDTPTKEQALAAQRKRLYNSSAENRNMNQSGTLFKSISGHASNAVAAISKARFDSPVPRIRNAPSNSRPASFSRQNSSQQPIGSQESVFPGGSQQSLQSYASEAYHNGLPDSAYSTQLDPRIADFEEPPRKRMRPTPTNEMGMNDGFYDMSMREVSPTEANESFAYHHQNMGDEIGPLAPMSKLTTAAQHQKKMLLMTLFHHPVTADLRSHDAFTQLSVDDLNMQVDGNANTALHWAAALARIPLLKILVSKGANICRVNKAGETVLMKAVSVVNPSDTGTFPDLLEVLAPTLDFRDSQGGTILHHIAVASGKKGHSQAAKYYLESLLEFVVRQPSSQQPFDPGYKTFNIGRFMSEIINVQDKAGDTALLLASRIGNRSIISQLMEVGADPLIANRSNLNPQAFGVGGPPNSAARIENRSRTFTGVDAKESSGDIIACSFPSTPRNRIHLLTCNLAITTLLQENQAEFTAEIEAKQSAIDKIHQNLRETSKRLGEQRQKYEFEQQEAKVRDIRKLKITNLIPAIEDEGGKLNRLQQQLGMQVSDGNGQMKLGDADAELSIQKGSQQGIMLGNIDLNAQPLDQGQAHLLNTTLPPAHVLRARLAAYNSNNASLEEGVKALQSKSSELAAKYRVIIGLCTGTEEKKVDALLGGLLRAVESERDVELGRVREFLMRVGEGE